MQTTFPPLELEAVKCIQVHHLHREILTPMAIPPEQLKEMSHAIHFESKDPKDIQAAYEALSASKPVLDPAGHIDARWGAFFIGDKGEVLLSVYTDGFGGQGTIDGSFVSYTYPTYIEWLEKRFSEGD